MHLKLCSLLFLSVSLLSGCSHPSIKTAPPETCVPDVRNNVIQCTASDGVSKITRPLDINFDNDYSCFPTLELGRYLESCK